VPIPYDAIMKSVLVLVAYIVSFISATMVVFHKKDIQS